MTDFITTRRNSRGDQAMATHTDPVCGMKVDDQRGKPHSTYLNNTYHFCGEGCKVKFDKNPSQYAGQQAGR
ncbi:MAG: YHS domain-containing protein [Thermoanaerobaculia bacterium]